MLKPYAPIFNSYQQKNTLFIYILYQIITKKKIKIWKFLEDSSIFFLADILWILVAKKTSDSIHQQTSKFWAQRRRMNDEEVNKNCSKKKEKRKEKGSKLKKRFFFSSTNQTKYC